MSSSAELLTEGTRGSLSTRQAKTVQKLADAAVAELRKVPFDKLTVRNVAKRAGVAPATAYTYFVSKEHLVTEAYWRLLSSMPGPRVNRRRTAAARVTEALADVARLASDEPELVAACTVAMMADDVDIRRLRDRIGADFHRRFRVALGDDADAAVVEALELTMAGALVRAGTGHMTYGEIPERMAEVATLLLERRP